MIRVSRPAEEPPGLAVARAKGLAATRPLAQAGTLVSKDFTGYQVARASLYEAQHGKCAYCEWSPLAIDWSPTEHFRPKGTYWWLAWSWSNLLFACQWCNTTHKGTRFPLREPATELAPEDQPPGAEDPLLLDPAGAVDPRRHIQFVLLDDRWRPIPRGGSTYGEATINVLGLDQPPLRDKYQKFFVENLRHRIENVRHAIAATVSDDLDRHWEQLIEMADPTRDFSGFALDVIEQEFADDTRAEWGLRLPSL